VGEQFPGIDRLGQLVEIDPAGSIDGVDAHSLAEALLRAGIAAGQVLTAHQLADDPFVRSTDLYQTVTSDELGAYEVTGLPWRIVDHPAVRLEAAPERSDAS